MDRFSLGAQVECNIGQQSNARQHGVWLDLSLNGSDGRRSAGDRLAARMLPCPHAAIACHLLAAFHFRLRHVRIGQASERRSREPNRKESEDDNGSTPHQNYMLPFAQAISQLASSGTFRPHSKRWLSRATRVLQNAHDGGDCVPVARCCGGAVELVDLAEVADGFHMAAVHAEDELAFAGQYTHEPLAL